MFRFSSIPLLERELLTREPLFAAESILLTPVKEIPYGVQIAGENSRGETGVISCYHSAKKGFSAVASGKGALTPRMAQIFLGLLDDPTRRFRAVLGTDETGKGDFFGPLTVAGFMVPTPEIEAELVLLGVKDSKKLKDPQIQKIARELKTRWPHLCKILAPSVEKYNELYAKIGNLNRLLGWMHGRLILDLTSSLTEHQITPEEIIIDQFAEKRVIVGTNRELLALPISTITKGEEHEIAIAAASIIARDHFVYRLKLLGEACGYPLSAGAGAPVEKLAARILKEKGRDFFHTIAKTHFKTIDKISQTTML